MAHWTPTQRALCLWLAPYAVDQKSRGKKISTAEPDRLRKTVVIAALDLIIETAKKLVSIALKLQASDVPGAC
jgi:hypothetical protein